MIDEITTRTELIAALSTAAELEHLLCCKYLFAGFSLKMHPDEGGADWVQLKAVRDWKTSLLLIAREEMAHLGIVSNLLTSIGATPHFRRPEFPVPAGTYGALGEFNLDPFSKKTIQSFAHYEAPEALQLRAVLKMELDELDCDGGLHLGHIVERICVDLHWDYGEAHTWDHHNESPDLHTAYLRREKDHAEVQERIHHYLGTEEDNIHELIKKAMKSCKTERMKNADIDLSTYLTSALPYKLSSAVAIPILEKDSTHPFAVLLFAFKSDGRNVERKIKTLEQVFQDKESLFAPGVSVPSAAQGAQLRAPGQLNYATLGGFYRQIREGFRWLAEADGNSLFIGPSNAQVDTTELNLIMPDWFNMKIQNVENLDSAIEAIDSIIAEGRRCAGGPHRFPLRPLLYHPRATECTPGPGP